MPLRGIRCPGLNAHPLRTAHVCPARAVGTPLYQRMAVPDESRCHSISKAQNNTAQFRTHGSSGGVFAQRAHSAGTAPIITVIIQVTPLKTTHLRNHAQSIQNSKIQTSDACHGSQGPKFCPVHCSSHSMTSFQPSELTELPVVENSQLFAQRTVRPLKVYFNL